MALKSLTTLPPGGWTFEQKDGGGRLVLKKFRSMSPFADAVKEIVDFRKGNTLPGADSQTVAKDLEEFTCRRLGYDPNFCWSGTSQKKTPYQPVQMFRNLAQHVRDGAALAATRLGQLDSGQRILRDWLGDGGLPVSTEQAQARADTCTGRLRGTACPHNKSGFKPVEMAAELIRGQVEKKNELKLHVEGEDTLHTCDICFCKLSLKAWVPLNYIVDNTPKPMLDKFKNQAPTYCWLVNEMQPPAK